MSGYACAFEPERAAIAHTNSGHLVRAESREHRSSGVRDLLLASSEKMPFDVGDVSTFSSQAHVLRRLYSMAPLVALNPLYLGVAHFPQSIAFTQMYQFKCHEGVVEVLQPLSHTIS